MMITKEKDSRLSTYYSWVRQNGIFLTFLPGTTHRAEPVSGCPSPMSVLWKYLWNSRINWEWCSEGLLNAQSNIDESAIFPKLCSMLFLKGMCNCWHCKPFQSNGMNTLAKPSHNKHAGTARGTRMKAQARWNPSGDSGLGIDSTWGSMDGRSNERSAIFFRGKSRHRYNERSVPWLPS